VADEVFFRRQQCFPAFFCSGRYAPSRRSKEIVPAGQAGANCVVLWPAGFFEVAWVLHSHFRLPNDDVLDKLESMLTIPHCTVSDADLIAKAVTVARNNSVGFADGYIAATAKEKDIGIATFNTVHFKKTNITMFRFSD
jgi:predicted nucleic acid-binding protein